MSKSLHVFRNPNPTKATNCGGDCVARAISIATDQPWDEVYTDLCDLGSSLKRMPNSKTHITQDYL